VFKESYYMAHDIDRPDDSDNPRHAKDSVAEETSAIGQRVKGAIKEEVGDLIDDEEMENKGARENEAGKDRQKKNDAV
jgi:uncharacterized protein YjbJ (UPF0337 family)